MPNEPVEQLSLFEKIPVSKFEKRQCPICHKIYYASKQRLKYGRQTTCSRKCSYKLRAKKQTKEKPEHTCPVCGKVFKKRVYQESQAVYCSRECACKGQTLGYTKRHVDGGYNTSRTVIEATCKNCGKDFEYFKGQNRKYCSRECFLESHKERMRGKNNPAWIDGRSYDKRCFRGFNWAEQRKKCYSRDNYICQVCGVQCIGRRDLNENNGNKLIQCHHIEDFESEEESNNLDNLTTLCASCHGKVHEDVIQLGAK